MDSLNILLLIIWAFASLAQAQQYMGDVINNSLPLVNGTEIAYFRIPDPAGKNNNLTLINYYSHGNDGKRIVESNIQRAVIIVHGLFRDPWSYEAHALSALYQVNSPDINFDTVAIITPYFTNGDDKNIGYPWTTGPGSTSNALVWPGSQWSAGGNAQYPSAQKNTISSYYVLDTLVKYFDDKALFPNVKQIVVGGHSLGAQTVQRYAAIGKQLKTNSPVTYWVANPNSYVWMDTSRPFETSSCPSYDVYREGFTNFTTYPMTYATDLVAQGRAAILSNYNSKSIAYARGLQDLGDDSSSCAPFTTGGNRNERFYNFIKAVPPSCNTPADSSCDTIDLINAGHDDSAMMAAPAGRARLFVDNFYGNGSRAFDFGYPRIQIGDDPFPDPAQIGSILVVNNSTYAGNMTYYGCWSDQAPATLPHFAFDNNSNTVELCTSTCTALGYTIAGVEYGSQCFCGNKLAYKTQRVVDSSCSFACAGNSSETCGGLSRIAIFSNGSPTQYAPPQNVPTVGPYQYSACVLEIPGRALPDSSTYSDSMTVESCASFCSAYKYFATEFSRECYCGDELQSGANVTNSGGCSSICSGNPLEFCGGANRLSLYVQTALNDNPFSSAALSSSTVSTTNAAASSSIGTISSSPTASLVASSTTTSPAYSSVSGYAYPTLVNDFHYVGCYTDGPFRTMDYLNGSTPSMTPQVCAQTCRTLGYRYAGSEYSSECWCDNYLTSTEVPDTDCANPCTGDSSQNCGGSYRLSVTQDITWRQTIFTRQSYSTWNLVGCYADDPNNRLLDNFLILPAYGSDNTVANCLTACTDSGYKYCGTEFSSECYGSSTAPTIPVISSDPLIAGCKKACAANSTEACGGNARITVYVDNGASP